MFPKHWPYIIMMLQSSCIFFLKASYLLCPVPFTWRAELCLPSQAGHCSCWFHPLCPLIVHDGLVILYHIMFRWIFFCVWKTYIEYYWWNVFLVFKEIRHFYFNFFLFFTEFPNVRLSKVIWGKGRKSVRQKNHSWKDEVQILIFNATDAMQHRVSRNLTLSFRGTQLITFHRPHNDLRII